jgi:hypothetical protein
MDGIDFEDMAGDMKIDGQGNDGRDNEPCHHSGRYVAELFDGI